MTSIGERIKNERTSKGLSLDKLSKLSTVSKTYLSELENGLKANPSADVLVKIATALDVSLPYLLEGEAKDDIADKPIPKTLKEFALEKDLRLSDVIQLLETANLGLAHRGKKVEGEQISKDGWEKLYNTLHDQGLI